MRANRIDRFGDPSVLHLVPDAEVPVAGHGQVRVQTLVAGVNPIDYKIREGSHALVKDAGAEIFPVILGREACGILLDDADGLPAGTRVLGMVGGGLGGCYAETCLLPADGIVAAPEGVPSEVLGGAPLAWYTAVAAAETLGQVRADDIVLIHGAGGGVGQFITQLCVAAGAQVWASASARHHDRLESFGATHVDYTSTDVFSVVPRPTLVIDCVWFGTFEPSIDHLADGGRMVVLPSLADLSEARRRGIPVSIPAISPDRVILQRLADALADGSIRYEIAQTFPLEDAAAAHRLLETGHAPGKLVLTVR